MKQLKKFLSWMGSEDKLSWSGSDDKLTMGLILKEGCLLGEKLIVYKNEDEYKIVPLNNVTEAFLIGFLSNLEHSKGSTPAEFIVEADSMKRLITDFVIRIEVDLKLED